MGAHVIKYMYPNSCVKLGGITQKSSIAVVHRDLVIEHLGHWIIGRHGNIQKIIKILGRNFRKTEAFEKISRE